MPEAKKRPYSYDYKARANPRRYLLSGIPPTLWENVRAKARREQGKSQPDPLPSAAGVGEPRRDVSHSDLSAITDGPALVGRTRASQTLQARDLPRKPFCKADVVGIHPRNEFPSRKRNRLIETRRKAGRLRFAHQANAIVAETFDDSAALIG